jgi:hypothetical protein
MSDSIAIMLAFTLVPESGHILDLSLEEKANENAGFIDDLKRLETDLRQLHALGLTFPIGDVEGKTASAIWSVNMPEGRVAHTF